MRRKGIVICGHPIIAVLPADQAPTAIIGCPHHHAGSGLRSRWRFGSQGDDEKVMRRARFDPKAGGIDGAVTRDNLIGATDQRTTSGPTGVMTRIKQAEDMTAPTIKRNTAK